MYSFSSGRFVCNDSGWKYFSDIPGVLIELLFHMQVVTIVRTGLGCTQSPSLAQRLADGLSQSLG
jgi:hypothetical protein